MKCVIVVGTGKGGLTTAAVPARGGVEVALLKARVCPRGRASTCFRHGQRFNAGAMLAGDFYPGGPMVWVSQAAGEDAWSAHPIDSAIIACLPEGAQTIRQSF